MNAGKVFDSLCRVCLNDCSRLINLFNNSTALNDTIVNVLMSCVPLQVSKGDGLPTFICRTCYRKLKISNQFQKLVMKSDRILRQHLENAKRSDFEQDDCLCNEDRCFLVSNCRRFDFESLVDVTSESDIESMNCWDQQSLNDQLAACFKAMENIVAGNENAKSDRAVEDLTVNIKKEIDVAVKFDETKDMSCDVNEDIKIKIEPEETEEARSDTEVNSMCSETSEKNKCLNFDERCKENSKERNDPTATKQQKDAIRGENSLIEWKTKIFCSDLNRINGKNMFDYKSDLNYIFRRISQPIENRCTVFGESSKKDLKPKDKSEYKISNSDVPRRGNSKEIAEPQDNAKVTLFRCDICEKCFIQLKNLRIHKRLAHNEKPCYECDICGKRLARNRSLIAHKRRHTGDKPFECLICKKGFIDKNELRKHKLVHTRDKLFQCDICARFYTQSSSLSAHKRIQHNILKNPQRSYNYIN